MDFGNIADKALLWIVLLPLFGAVINGVAGRFADRQLVGAVGVGSVALAFVLALISFFHLNGLKTNLGDDAAITQEVYHWFSLYVGTSEVPLRVAFVFDSLSAIMTLVVTGVGLLIHIYSLEYMHDDPGYARFFTYLNLFMASMLILVLGSSLPLMFVGWEGVGLCSYLLIGFWFENGDYAAAGKKAFIVNRIGDFGVLLAMFVLLMATRSLEFDAINDSASSLGGPFFLGRFELGSTATVAALLLFLGCAGKSAQIPLYVWLPDAMAGPTPVSALIHAATMVTSGVYLCCRLSPVFVESATAMAVVAVVGALTALLAASIALVQNQMKRILAYSTVSQLGFMFAAVGCGAFAAGIFHVYTHAFFKACLFLGAGAVMHAVHAHGDADIRKLGGLKDKLPVVHWTFLVSCCAIAGVPLFSGWFSKDEILLGALNATQFWEQSWVAWFVFVVLVLAATMTAFYMFRMYFIAFHGTYRSAKVIPEEGEEGEEEKGSSIPPPGHEEEHGYDPHPHRPGMAIRGVLAVLGAGAILVGLINLEPLMHFLPFLHLEHHGNFWGAWLSNTVAVFEADIGPLSWAAVVGGLAAMGTGIGIAFTWYKQQGRMPMAQPMGLAKVLMNKWYVDELYEMTIIRWTRGLAIFAAAIDKYFVDGILARATALGVTLAGWLSTRIQNGVVYSYGAVMVVGMAVLAWWFVYPHPSLEGTATRTDVTWTSGQGLGYEYRWDVDDDGEVDTEWSASENSASYTYVEDDWVGYALLTDGERPGELEETFLDEDGDDVSFGEEELGRGWELDPEAGSSLMPTFHVAQDEEGGIIFRRNHARARVRGGEATEEERLRPGDIVQVGSLNVRVGAVVRATLEVRNTFGNIARQTEEIVIQPSGGSPAEVAALEGGAQ
jgi:NADH-quinone oxidoreductase subunit L